MSSSLDPIDPDRPVHHVIIGAGPVGRAVADHLVEGGTTPTLVTRSGTAFVGTNARTADMSDPIAAKHALADADIVHQCSQPEYHRWPEEFPPLQAGIADAATAAGARLVVIDNLYGYGAVDGPITEDLPAMATGRKGRTRATMWQDLVRRHEAGDLAVVAARASDFYGPHTLGSSYGERLFARLVAGKAADVVGDPTTRHSVTYVPDVGAAMVRLALSGDAWGRAWHVPNAPAVTGEEFVALAAVEAGTSARVSAIGATKLRLAGLFIPAARETIEMLHEFDRDFVVDHGAYAQRFGDDHTPLSIGIASTVRWYQNR